MLLRAGKRIVTGMTTETFQIPIEAAEQYEANFVPAFFSQWAARLCDAAGVAPGQRVLDVACGTGIVARTAEILLGRGYAPKVMLSPNVTDYQAANANNDKVYEDLWRRLTRR